MPEALLSLQEVAVGDEHGGGGVPESVRGDLTVIVPARAAGGRRRAAAAGGHGTGRPARAWRRPTTRAS